MKFDILPLFSQPLASFQLDIDNKKILHVLKTKLKFEKTVNKNTDSYMSTDNKIFNNYKELSLLKKESNICIKKYIEEVLKNNFKFKIYNSWGTMVPINVSSQAHIHRNSLLSGVYYPLCSDGVKITFHKNEGIETFYAFNEPREYNLFNSNTWTVSPSAGTLLIFPSTLMHSIDKNITKGKRYSIAFSVNPVGKFCMGSDIEVEFK